MRSGGVCSRPPGSRNAQGASSGPRRTSTAASGKRTSSASTGTKYGLCDDHEQLAVHHVLPDDDGTAHTSASTAGARARRSREIARLRASSRTVEKMADEDGERDGRRRVDRSSAASARPPAAQRAEPPARRSPGSRREEHDPATRTAAHDEAVDARQVPQQRVLVVTIRSARARAEQEPGGQRQPVDPRRRGLAAVGEGGERLAPDRDADDARRRAARRRVAARKRRSNGVGDERGQESTTLSYAIVAVRPAANATTAPSGKSGRVSSSAESRRPGSG